MFAERGGHLLYRGTERGTDLVRCLRREDTIGVCDAEARLELAEREIPCDPRCLDLVLAVRDDEPLPFPLEAQSMLGEPLFDLSPRAGGAKLGEMSADA